MIDETQQDQAALYALGQLSGDEAAAFRAAMSRERELQRLVDEMQESAAAIVHALPSVQAPPDLLPRLLAQLEGERPAPRRGAWIPWAIAASIAVLAGAEFMHFTDEVARLSSQNSELQTQKAFAETEQQRLLAQATKWEAERDAMERQLSDLRKRDALSELKIAALKAQVKAYANVVAVSVWDEEKQQGLVRFKNLPQAASGKDYQMWVIDPAQKAPISAGLLPAGEGGAMNLTYRPGQKVGTANAFAISVEKKGGSPTPQGQIVLVGEF
jgi:anti-sigma-K factor RskA